MRYDSKGIQWVENFERSCVKLSQIIRQLDVAGGQSWRFKSSALACV